MWCGGSVGSVTRHCVPDQINDAIHAELQEGCFLALWNTVRAHLTDRGAIEPAILSSQRDAHLDGEGSHRSDGNASGDPDLVDLIDPVTRLSTNQVGRTITTPRKDWRCSDREVPTDRDVPGVVLRIEVS